MASAASSRLWNTPGRRVTRIDGTTRLQNIWPPAEPSSCPFIMRSPCSSSSPATPLKYHLMRTSPFVDASRSCPQRLSSSARTLPSGATDPNFRTIGSSAEAPAATRDTHPDSKSVTKARMEDVQEYHATRLSFMVFSTRQFVLVFGGNG